MVMRPFRNITLSTGTTTSTKPKSGFSFSRNVSSSSNNCTHKFFNPSYIPSKDLIKVDEIGFKSNSHSKNSTRSIFKYVAPALSVTKNYVIFDRSNNHVNSSNTNIDLVKKSINENNSTATNPAATPFKHIIDDRILLRKLNYVGNRNSHINITVDSVNSNHTVLKVRRANSNNIKKIAIPHNNVTSRRNYSTNALQQDFQKLNIDENKQETATHDDEFRKLNNEKIQAFDNVNDALDTFLYNNPTKSQEYIIDKFISLNKFNEILPIFNRMRNNKVIPTIEIYNKVLKSIKLRKTDENLEVNLTHLLNIYSDMLSNNLKPNNETYELVIDSLIDGSLNSYKCSNYKNGYEFFKIAFELFLINQNKANSATFQNNQMYLNILRCLNSYKIVDVINPSDLFNLMNMKINSKNRIQFYVMMIKFSTLFKNVDFMEHIYNDEIKTLNNLNNHDLIYQTMIESYNLCEQFSKSTLLLDSIINNLPNKNSVETQNLISTYLSSFIKSQSLVDPKTAFKMVYKFNNIEWLPSLPIESLLVLSYAFLNNNDLKMAIKVWDFIVVRKDFNYRFQNLMVDEYSIYLDNYFDRLLGAVLVSNDKNLIFKFTREILNKNCLVVENNLLINILNYLKQFENTNEILLKLVLNQGYKKLLQFQANSAGKKPDSINNYLSLMVDFIPTAETLKIFNSSFFKRVVEDYRVIRDNVYGIMKVFSGLNLDSYETTDKNTLLKLAYYSKVLNYEFTDVDNCYVQLPPEIHDFKHKLQQFT